MSNDNIIAAIDVWSSKIRTVVSAIDDEKKTPHIIWLWTSFSNWIRKWKIVDLKELVENINTSLEEAETMSWIPVQSVFISVNNSQIESFESKWIIAIQWKEIEEADIERAMDSAQSISPAWQWRDILEVIPKFFVIDNQDPVSSPLWMSWIRLESDVQIITSTDQSIKNIEKAINQVWSEIIKEVPAVLASSKAVLTKKQKEIWVVNIDIWSSSTWIAVYEEWVCLFCGGLSIWWENVTNDIAIWLRTSPDTAEDLKIEYWTTNDNLVWEKDEVDLSIISSIDSWKISKKQLSKIMKARYEEIFYMIKQELKVIWRDWMLPWWVILTWWWVKAPWVDELCKEVMQLPVQIWFPADISSVIDKINDPEYATSIWLIKYWSEWDTKGSWWFSVDFWWFSSILKWFKNLLPN